MLAVIENIESDEDRHLVQTWYEDYHKIMEKKSYEIIKNYDVVNDMVNSSFVNIIRHMDVVKKLSEAARAVYIMNTVTNVCIDYCRRKKIENKHIDKYAIFNEVIKLKDIKDEKLQPEKTYETKEFFENIEKYIEQLSDQDREILKCKVMWELSDKETAERLNMSAQNVHTYNRRAKARLINLMNKGENNEKI